VTGDRNTIGLSNLLPGAIALQTSGAFNIELYYLIWVNMWPTGRCMIERWSFFFFTRLLPTAESR
jgi:hypothetical protein